MANTALVERYRENYGLPDKAELTEEMVLSHWRLEKRLALELFASKAENRREIFCRAYTELFSHLSWMESYFHRDESENQENRFDIWPTILGWSPMKVFEVGSGRGMLLKFLARKGYSCKGTEITSLRGACHAPQATDNLTWGQSDGIHLDGWEEPSSYDVVITSQVVEHFHPEDLKPHLRSAHGILNEKGRYILITPHRATGPHDISKVFLTDEVQGMHLKEYTYQEICRSF